MCSHNFPEGRGCAACNWRDGQICTLTSGPAAARRWCCHRWLALANHGWRPFEEDDLRGHLRRWGLGVALEMYGVEYRLDEGAYLVNLGSLSVPVTYGVPTVHWVDALTGGAEAWQEEELPLAESDFVLIL